MEHSFSLVSGQFKPLRGGRYCVDTSRAPLSVNLPDPQDLIPGEAVFFMDMTGSFTKHPLTLLADGTTINGTASSLILDTSGDSIGLTWTGTTWRTYE
jgi:hypothetical protein